MWTEQAKLREVKAEAAVAKVETPPKALADIPPHIEACLKHGAARATVSRKQALAVQGKGPAPSADELVAAKLQNENERNACTAALLTWYRAQQKLKKDREKGSAKVASAAK